MRKLILTSASVIALGLAAGAGYAQSTTSGTNSAGLPANNSAPVASTPGAAGNTGATLPSTAMPSTSGNADMSAMQHGNQMPQSGRQMTEATRAPSRDMIRQAQEQLQSQGLYRGRVDGRLGHQTKQALARFQSKNGLQRTATLDPSTLDRLLGSGGNVGSSTQPGKPQSLGRMPETVQPGHSTGGTMPGRY